jgi:hypothetical protein
MSVEKYQINTKNGKKIQYYSMLGSIQVSVINYMVFNVREEEGEGEGEGMRVNRRVNHRHYHHHHNILGVQACKPA